MPPAPNPYHGSTTIRFAIPGGSGGVEIAVFDISGRRLRQLANRPFEPGIHALAWDGADEAGRRLAPGMYMVRLTTGDEVRTTRIMRVP